MFVLTVLALGAAMGQAATIGDLMEADRTFNRMAQTEGAREAFLAFVGNNPTMLADGLDPITGNEAVGEFLNGWPDSISLTWEPKDGRIAESGELGYTWGTFVSRSKEAEGNEVVKSGKYVTVWALQDDGTWKWVIDIGNSNPASQGTD
jgi:ketosteroid isomerase-like protein